MNKTIKYNCCSCESESDVPIEVHEDSSIYMECYCGEESLPSDENDNETKDTKHTGPRV